jgi:hypothetical protein
MADIYLDVDTALAEVPVNLMPLLDDTDFKTIEDAVAYNAAGMALRWHFITSAGAYSVTSVTPTTAGVHDWTDQGDSGVYTIEIPASGGTINNDTEGYGWFTGTATGVLPWRGPVICFRAAAINDALCDGGDLLDVNVTQNGGTAITSASGVQEVKVASMASGSITAAAAATDFGTEVADAIWDEVVEHTFTGRQLMRLFAATLAGQASGLGTTTAVYKGLDDSTTRISATVDADGNRTSVSRTVS